MNSNTETNTVTPAATQTNATTLTRTSTFSLIPQSTVIPLPNIESGTEFVTNTNLVLPGELIRGLLHRRSKGVLGGSSKVGKTWMLLDLALSVASGTQVLGFNTVAGRVLFINLEIDKPFFQRRVQAVQDRKGITSLNNLDIWNLRGEKVTVDRLIGDLRRQLGEPYALIIIDPIYKLMTGRSESVGSNISTLAYNIDRLISQTGSAVIYTNHYTKGNQSKKQALNRLGGSGVYGRDADTIITLTEHRQLGCFTVETIERNLPPTNPFVVEWQYPLMVLRPRINPDDLLTRERTEPSELEMEYVCRQLEGTQLTTEAWQAAAIEGGISAANFLRIRQHLEANGRVQHDNENIWHLIPTAPTAPPNGGDAAPADSGANNHPIVREAWRTPHRRRGRRAPTTPEPQAPTMPPPIDPDQERPLILGDL